MSRVPFPSPFPALPISADFDTPTAAYLHIPFCRRRCYYCDFAVSIIGDTSRGETSRAIAQYVDLLLQEIQTTLVKGDSLQSVFFGGGTPSLLSVDQLDCILDALHQRFGIAPSAEISMEMDPGTFDETHLSGYLKAGVNRVSLGVQAFQAELLAACGRTHTPRDIELAIALLKQEGVYNFSLDLISGLPHQTMAQWQESLERAITLQPTHISVYDLTIEPITAFGRWYTPGAHPLPSDEMTADMYRQTQQTFTQAGYDHYEISNYAKPGFQCRHNRIYWENRSYYGFGMGAASYTQGQRFTRPRTRREYAAWVERLQSAGGRIDCPVTTDDERLLDTLMVGLRLAKGVSLTRLSQEFGEAKVEAILNCLKPYEKERWVVLSEVPSEQYALLSTASEMDDSRTSHRLRLSDPEGFLFSNVVLSTLFEALPDNSTNDQPSQSTASSTGKIATSEQTLPEGRIEGRN